MPFYQQYIWTAWDCLNKYLAPAACCQAQTSLLTPFTRRTPQCFLLCPPCSSCIVVDTWSSWPLWTSSLIYVFSLNCCLVLWSVLLRHLASFTYSALQLPLQRQQYLAIFSLKHWGDIYLVSHWATHLRPFQILNIHLITSLQILLTVITFVLFSLCRLLVTSPVMAHPIHFPNGCSALVEATLRVSCSKHTKVFSDQIWQVKTYVCF